MNSETLKKLKTLFALQPEVKLAYLFGSRAYGEAGPLSDYDFAVYLEEQNKVKMAEIQFGLMDKLSRLLQTDKVDVVILNLAEGPELKYNIISQGELLYEVEPYKVLIEPQILNEYFDFRAGLLRYHLTEA